MNEERIGCEFCYYEYFDGKAYPCSMCIRGEERTDKFEPKGRQTKQTEKSDSEYYLELADAVMRGEMSDAEANQAWYEYINKQVTPQTDCPFKDVPCSCGEQDECEWHTKLDTPQTDCSWK